jgi:hypothetical protein
MSADRGLGSSSVNVRCCVASWNDRHSAHRRSLVLIPSQGEHPVPYAWRRLLLPEQPDVLTGWGVRAAAAKAQNLQISVIVEIDADEESLTVWTDAIDDFLCAKDRAEGRYAKALERARRWGTHWLNPRAYRRFELQLAAAERTYQQAVGDLPARVRSEIVKAEIEIAKAKIVASERRAKITEECERRHEERQQAVRPSTGPRSGDSTWRTGPPT